ncbi:hypothetical protein [Microvirga roseola]|uniref:hypothetical protein n=1 Tax=Microvirga roseola TaxID=2883126 RepID=UPI001E2836E0|nr:hypothetical protein [Microvirga roseola]
MNRKQEFQGLYKQLGLPATDVASLIGRSLNTTRQYVSNHSGSRVPPEGVLLAMRDAWKRKAQSDLDGIIRELQTAGIQIDWASLEDVGTSGCRSIRPKFLGAVS